MNRYHVACFWALLLIAGCTEEPLGFQALGDDGKPAKWQRPQLELVVSKPLGGTRGDQRALLETTRLSLAAWGPLHSLEVKLLTSDRYIPVAEDGTNVVTFVRPSKLRRPGGLVTPAEATLRTRATRGTDHAEIIEADIAISTSAVDWASATASTELQALITHELGHVLGLDHICAELDGFGPHTSRRPRCHAVSRSLKSAIMYPDPLERGRPLVLAPLPSERRYVARLYGPTQ